MRLFYVVVLFLSSLAPQIAFAGNLQEKALLAETHLDKGDYQGALKVLDEARAAVNAAMPLSFAKALLVTSTDGYGLYQPAATQTYKAGDTLRIYAEPLGYGQSQTAAGYEIRMSTDVEIRNTTGQILGTSENFAAFGGISQSHRDDLSIDLSVNVPDLRPGEYALIIRLRDTLSDKAGEFTIAFTLAE